jgi:hypothetical protein
VFDRCGEDFGHLLWFACNFPYFSGAFLCFSCTFAGRNSLRTGNLTGNLQNSAESAPFGLPPRLDLLTYQYVKREFPVPEENRNFLRETANSLEGHWPSS